MLAGDLGFVAMAINPIGGLLIAIPFAVFELGYRPWVALALGVPLAYVQVLAVDLLWTSIEKIPGFTPWLLRRRSPRVARLVESKGNFWATLLFSPLIGPWLVMAFMRYAAVPLRRVALPLLLGIVWSASGIAAACAWAPRLLGR
jgi:hypothetical protein